MMKDRKLILYIAISLDGFIATSDNDLSFLSIVDQKGEDYGYYDFVNSIDTIIIGRKSYEKVISMGYDYPHIDKEVYIISRKEPTTISSFRFYSGNLTALVLELKSKPGKNIYCDGGAEIVTELLKDKLIDEFFISIIPILLGDGIRLFKLGNPEQTLMLVSSRSFKKGLVQIHYKIADK